MINAHRQINLNAESCQTVLRLVARQGFGYHALGNLSIEKSIDIAVTIPKRCFAHLRQEGLDHRQSPTLLNALNKEITRLFGSVRNSFKTEPTIGIEKTVSVAFQSWDREAFLKTLSSEDQKLFLKSHFGQSDDARSPALCTHFNMLAAAIVATLSGKPTTLLQRINSISFGDKHTLCVIKNEDENILRYFDSSLYRSLERRRSDLDWLDPKNIQVQRFFKAEQTFNRIYKPDQISGQLEGGDPWALQIVPI